MDEQRKAIAYRLMSIMMVLVTLPIATALTVTDNVTFDPSGSNATYITSENMTFLTYAQVNDTALIFNQSEGLTIFDEQPSSSTTWWIVPYTIRVYNSTAGAYYDGYDITFTENSTGTVSNTYTNITHNITVPIINGSFNVTVTIGSETWNANITPNTTLAQETTIELAEQNVPILTTNVIELDAYTDTAMYIEVECSDDSAIATGYPVMNYTLPNGTATNTTFTYDYDDIYYTYILFDPAGVYSDITITCCDLAGNCATNTQYNITSVVRDPTSFEVGGVGGTIDTSRSGLDYNYSVVPSRISYSIAQGKKKSGTFEIVNNENLTLSFVVNILRNARTANTYDWMQFDNSKKAQAFDIEGADEDLNSRYTTYEISVPEDAAVGKYQGTIEINGEETVKLLYIEINVREPITLKGILEYEVFALPTMEQILAGDLIIEEGEETGKVTPLILFIVVIFISVMIYLFRRKADEKG